MALLWLAEVLVYLRARGIGCYRLPDDMAAALAAGDSERVARELDECGELLGRVRGLAEGVRLTMHLDPTHGLGAADEGRAEQAAREIAARAELLAALGGPECVVVTHVGAGAGERRAAIERCAARLGRLAGAARGRVAIEPDGRCFALGDVLRLHELSGAPVVLDTLHHQIHNTARVPLAAALGLALATWAPGVRPKVHLSTQRTEAHLLPGRPGEPRRVVPPAVGQHADFISPADGAAMLAAARGMGPYDVMLEAKAADLALARLREDLWREAPELAPLVEAHGEGSHG